ncbi:LOW QUALITY PROTEIN: uncharacterized protein LOC113519958 [Galleria mellonella]|uniref:LOW QUALITY PROTEIN: uncharacterized protein LOC113519958 n=1 Tax=Galleria mellonella TaxID=7137 RepID=A0ABM3M8W8_GALME|nr:LOW QUALITY PROTEIN: uncharacterized protein LOC113519958 [Galleria mellonella]
MNQNCFICDIATPTSKGSINIFDSNIGLQSGKKLPDILKEIIDKPIKSDNLYSNVLCKNCFKFCTEYDSIQVRLQVIRTNLLKDFKTTLPKHNLNYDTFGATAQSTPIKPTEIKVEDRRLVVPASKLQPLPADFVFDINKMVAMNKSLVRKVPTSESMINLKVTVGSSVLTQSVKTVMTPVSKELSPAKSTQDGAAPTNVVVTMLPTLTQHTDKVTTTKNPVLSFNVNSLQKELMSSTVLAKINQNDKGTNDYAINENNDDQSMEIDEDCSLVVPVTTNGSGKLVFEIDSLKNSKEKPKSNFFDVGLLLSDGNEGQERDADKYVLDKLHVLKRDEDDGDDEPETLVMEDEDGTTIIRMAAGQRVLYDGTKFVVADDDTRDDNIDNGDSQDSNEESQIELQVSGDEETANAIIAAAQEQGGAFIKVESGEMYRVKSVQSKSDDTNDDDDEMNLIQSMVQEEENGHFKCLLCANNKDSVEPVVLRAEPMMQHLRAQHAARLYICRVCGRRLRRRNHYTAHLGTDTTRHHATTPPRHHATTPPPTHTHSSSPLHLPRVRPPAAAPQPLHRAPRYRHTTRHHATTPPRHHATTPPPTHTHSSSPLHLPRVRPPAAAPQPLHRAPRYRHTTRHHATTPPRHHATTPPPTHTHSSSPLHLPRVRPPAAAPQPLHRAPRYRHTTRHHATTPPRHHATTPPPTHTHSSSPLHLPRVRPPAAAPQPLHRAPRYRHTTRHHATTPPRHHATTPPHRHRHTPTLARLYICRVCGRRLRRRNHYTAHLAEHVAGGTRVAAARRPAGGERPHRCALCGKTFASKYTHQAHLKTHQERPRPFKCDQCGKTFLTQQNLNQHEKTHLGIKDFICNICGKAFASQHNLEVHGVTHSGRRPFACARCGKAFARRPELRDHARVHTGERPFACEICGAAFAQRSNLHSHRRATHLADKRHACHLCPKRFKRRRLLEYHVKAAHTGERPLRCAVCRASFVYPEHYKKHARIHSGEKPYGCEVCGKSFNSRDNRNTHRFVHSDKKPYECFTCGAGYMRKRQLLAHMQSTGHVAESIVVNQPRVIKTLENTTMEVVNVSTLETDDKYDNNILYETKETELDVNTIGTVDISEDGGTTNLFITGDKKIILQDGKSSNNIINLIPDGEESLLTLQDIKSIKVDGATIEADVEGQPEMIVSDEHGSVMRLIQIQLPDGKTGWVAINKPLDGSLA